MIDRTMVLRSGLSRVFYLVGTACKSLFFYRSLNKPLVRKM
jgi:hypothetical protein